MNETPTADTSLSVMLVKDDAEMMALVDVVAPGAHFAFPERLDPSTFWFALMTVKHIHLWGNDVPTKQS